MSAKPKTKAAKVLTKEEWLAKGRTFGLSVSKQKWQIGDWLLEAPGEWREMYDEAVELTGYEEPALRDMKWLSRRFPRNCRFKSTNLSWTHYRVAADLPNTDDALRLLKDADAEKLSCKALRAKVVALKKNANDDNNDGDGDEDNNDGDNDENLNEEKAFNHLYKAISLIKNFNDLKIDMDNLVTFLQTRVPGDPNYMKKFRKVIEWKKEIEPILHDFYDQITALNYLKAEELEDA